MRVAFYAPLKPADHDVPSGDRRMARLLVQALELTGCRVELASRMRSFDGAGDGTRQARIRALGERLAQRYLDRCGAERPDIWFTYHLYHKAPDWLGPRVAGALGIPYVVAEASYAPKQAGGPWAIGHGAVATALAEARQVICLNPDDAECLGPLLSGRGSLAILKPFLDTAPARKAARQRDACRQDLSRQYGLDPEMPWLAVAAMMRPGDKLASYRVLGEALGGLRARRWVLLVAGDGESRSDVEAALGTGDRIRYVGTLDRTALDRLHAAADLAVWPAMNEAYGMALLEAQAAGLPVVAGDRTGVRQIVRDGRTGLLVAEGDSAALAAAVGDLLDDPARRRTMGAEALRVASAEHDIAVAAERLRAILTEASRPLTEAIP